MAKEKSLVEEALVSMKNLEETLAENAKGILASTMKEEIKELVKESLSEQEDDEDEIETDVDMEIDMGDESDEDEFDSGMDMNTDEFDTEDDVIDLRGHTDDDVVKVFKMMGPEDSIVVTKDEAGNLHLKDENDEYVIMSESDEEEMGESYEEEMDESDEEEMDESDEEEMDESVYELEMDEEDDSDIESIVDKVFGEKYHDTDEEDDDDIVYEIVMDDDEDDEDYLEESKMKIKPKGVGMGSPSKFKYKKKPNMDGGFNDDKKEAPKHVGTGKAKFEYKKGENAGSGLGKNKIVKPGTKKVETKEASRTLGSGSKFRQGGLPKPRAHSKFNPSIKESVDNRELELLREKNEEYRKALNVFRDKLNEVAVFNSNLAYCTRLFTEHSTSKQEKINILRRFDGVESIKESKNLYKTIKEELSSSNSSTKSITESVDKKIEKTVTSGSAVNLIESKTYENPQFLRMKDLMSKITK